tara:strand:+ start:590 stop:886 length:297 start_codon:yes stop_codon:yes gene_type:complete
MFENILGMVSNNTTMIASGGTAAIVLWVLKKIPNEQICGVIETSCESVGRVLTLNLSKWKATKSVWNSTIEPYFVDLIDNIFGSMVRGIIKGLRSDNK